MDAPIAMMDEPRIGRAVAVGLPLADGLLERVEREIIPERAGGAPAHDAPPKS